MFKKITLWISVMVLMVGILAAQERNDEPMPSSTEGAPRGMRRAGPGMQPGRDRQGFMRGGFVEWFNRLEEAYEQNNKEKVGELIAEMKQRMERMQSGMGRGDRPMRPEGQERPDRPMRPGGQERPDRPMRPGGQERPDRPMRPGGQDTGDRPARQERPGAGDQPMRFGPGRPAQGGESSFIQTKTLPKTDAEKKILSVLDNIDKNQRRGMMNVPVEDGRLLRLLTESINAKHVVEIGTSNGYSGIWFCLALQKTGGKLTTHEIDARRASLARENFKLAGVDKLVTLVEGDAHKTVTNIKEPIDILFLDADKEGYIDYLNKLLPLMRVGGLVIAHNINPRQADPNYIKAITTDPDLETIFYQQGGGVSVTLKKR
ncbi:MAG: O-methyltransferase [Planctomycetota bacterium]|jgi:predicted O-methyltransferase YrrM